tara:strand:- start:909 stop:1808 length:900 start_codon:yes stop_codon:yes gene_type:complete
VFVPIGGACVAANLNVVEVSARYDNLADCSTNFFPSDAEKALKASYLGAGTSCTVSLYIPKTMKHPVYVYYELNNFYQNHRRFVKSRSDEQLAGETTVNDFCSPQQFKDDANGTRVEINPCGLMAWSFFNDSYAASRVDSSGTTSSISINENGIAWPSDVEHKFGDVAAENFNDDIATRGGGQISGTLKTDEHFVVWMRTAAMSNFRKLWGKIEVDLVKGETVTVTIDNRFNSYAFDGEKAIVLSTTSWLGGKNVFLGTAYLTIGSLCFAAAAVFAYFAMYPPRQIGDVAEFMNTGPGQ